MRTIPTALTWELFSRGRWQLPPMICAGILLPILLYSALASQGAVSPADSAFIVIHLALVQVIMFTFGAGLMQALGSISRLYTYPARTSTLVAWQLLPAMALMLVDMMAISAMLNALYGVGWPLWGPSLFAAVALAAVLATMWLTEKSAWLPWAVGLVASGLGLWLKSRHGVLFDHPSHYWEIVTVWDGIVLTLIALSSYAVAVYGVSRHRRGDMLPALGIVAWFDRLLNSDAVEREVVAPFPSPVEAQLWFEWRKKGWGMPACVVFMYVFGGLGWLIFSRDPKLVVEGSCIGGGVLMGVMGLLGGLLLGDSGTREYGGALGQFLSTRPIPNTRLARIMLWNSAKSVGAAWLLWIVPSALISTVLVMTGTVQLSEIDPFLMKSWWWFLPTTLIAPWAVSTCLAAMALTGRQKLMMALFLGGFGVFIGLNMFAESALPYDQRLGFWRGVYIGISGLVVMGTILLFSLAKRRSLIDTPTVWASLAVWCLLIAGLIMTRFYDPRLPLTACVCIGGMLALTVAPFAGTPLALAWNRTR